MASDEIAIPNTSIIPLNTFACGVLAGLSHISIMHVMHFYLFTCRS